MSNLLKQTLSLLTFILLTSSQNCGPIDTSHQIQAGTYTVFQNDFSIQSIKTFQVLLRLFDSISNSQIAITTQEIFNLNSQGGISFYIKGQVSRISSNPALLIYLQSEYSFTWSSLKISYMVSQNDEIIMGSKNFLPTQNQITQETYSAQFSIPDFRLFPFTSYRAAIFISGFKTPSSNYQISILSSEVDEEKSLVLLQIDFGKSYIQVLSISYIVYDQSHDLFSFYNDGVGTYQLIGPVSMRGSIFSKTKLVICSKRYANFCPTGKIIINGDCFCPKDQVTVNSECVCENGFVRNSDNICVVQTQDCHQNQVFNNLKLICECQAGFVRVLGKCVENSSTKKCGEHEQFNEIYQICQCSPGYVKNTGTCVQIDCPEGTNFDVQQASCVSICSQNSQYNSQTGKCECFIGFYLKNSECLPIPFCPTGSSFNTATQLCVCVKPNEYLINRRCQSCRINEQFDGKQCVCIDDAHNVNGSCILCPPNSSFSNSQCICNNGFVFNSDGTQCIKKAECPKNSVSNSSGQCQCLGGFYKNDRGCERIPQCANGQLFNLSSHNCECVNGTHLINGMCKNCGNNEKWNGTACKCIDGTFLIDNQCSKCSSNKIYSAISKTCICDTNFIQINELCKLCPSGSSPSADRSTCVCQSSSIFNIDKLICESCPSNSSPDKQKNSCMCNEGFKLNTVANTCDSISSVAPTAPVSTPTSTTTGGIQIIFSSQFQSNGRIITFYKLSKQPTCLETLLNSASGTQTFLIVDLIEVKPQKASQAISYVLEYDPFSKEFIIDLFSSTNIEIGTSVTFSLRYNTQSIKEIDAKCYEQLDSGSNVTRTRVFETTQTFRR